MQFRIEITEKLDLSKFRKQAAYYTGQMRELSYHFYLPDYKVIVELSTPDDSNYHLAMMWIVEIFRDQDKEIIREQVVIPLLDTRFKESKDIQSLFPNDHYKTIFQSNNVKDTIDKICQLVKLTHKINGLKIFL
jgi:hypothetical protein